MRLTHLGHSCVLIDDPAGSAGTVLIDPGTLADSIDAIGDVDAVLITHEHPDHLELAKLHQLRRANPQLEVFASPGVPSMLPPDERERAVVLSSDDVARADIAGWDVMARTTPHATIHPALPELTNNAYGIAQRIWHPGDALVVPDQPVDILLLPIGAPWMKLSEAVDYLRAVAPRLAVPIHQGGLAPAHRELHCDLLAKFAPADTELLLTPTGVPVEL
ncbi:MBL fold metallo-hydrolase [Streptomyces sp. NPDC005820]|uniref:MBL fold metallo-hydrolase n=1 Tax=Streptomyces sp. NPDC005820 TaxID=3157069 RepID=UPI0033FD6D1A